MHCQIPPRWKIRGVNVVGTCPRTRLSYALCKKFAVGIKFCPRNCLHEFKIDLNSRDKSQGGMVRLHDNSRE